MGPGKTGVATLLAIAACALWGCTKPEPVGPDATAEELHNACEAGDLDACSIAAHRRSDQYEAAMRLN